MPADERDSADEQEPPGCRERIERPRHVGLSISVVMVTRALYNPQPRLAQQLDDVAKSQMAVAVKAAE
jgi:hypothetical protein